MRFSLEIFFVRKKKNKGKLLLEARSDSVLT